MDLGRLQDAAEAAATRGRHAFGFAWVDGKGRARMHKQAGDLARRIEALRMARDARMLIGHCRYATHGDAGENANNHPHPADGGWFVHNGTVAGHEALAASHGLVRRTDCDSEVIGLLAERQTGRRPEARMVAAVRAIPGSPTVVLGLWSGPGRMVAIKRTPARAGPDGGRYYRGIQASEATKPLWIGVAREGYYLGSLGHSLPGRLHEFEDNASLRLTADDARYEPLWPPKAGRSTREPRASTAKVRATPDG